MSPNSISKVRRFAPLFGALGLLLALFGWALASPVGASPDEDFHLVSIWCANGADNSMCENTGSTEIRLVNSALINAPCFAQKPTESAKCQLENSIFESTRQEKTTRGNFFGNYPQGFYATMHLFAGDDVQASVLAMRFFNALLFCAAMITLWLLISPRERQSLYFTVMLTVLPLGLFLIPSINPSSWAILGALTAFFATAGALSAQGKKGYLLWGLSLIGLTLAAASRYDGLLYSIVAFIAAFVLAHRFTISKKIWLISAGIIGTVMILALAFGGSTLIEKLTALAGSSSQNGEVGALGILFINVAQLPFLFAGFSGAMGLGWLDTAMPFTMWMLAATVLWASLFTRLAQFSKRSYLVVGMLAALLVFIPLLVLQASMATVGENVQSRYLYPLLLTLVASALYTTRTRQTFFSFSQIIVLVLALFISQVLALYTNMARYISAGASQSGWNLNSAAESGWWWPTAPSPMLIFILATIGFGLFLISAFIFSQRESDHDQVSELQTTSAPGSLKQGAL